MSQTTYFVKFKPLKNRHLDNQDTLIQSQTCPQLGVPLYKNMNAQALLIKWLTPIVCIYMHAAILMVTYYHEN